MRIPAAAGCASAIMLFDAMVVTAAASTLERPFSSPHIPSRYQAMLEPLSSSARSSWARLSGSSTTALQHVSSSPSFLENLSRHWKQADSTKQTFMALFLIAQIVVLLFVVKGFFDKMFGRRAEYRNRRTRRFARRAAVAAAGGLTKASIPFSHQRALYNSQDKPKLPPRPAANSPMMQSSTAQSQFVTNQMGEIVLPSWTEQGPTSLNVIVEEPEREQMEQELSHMTRKNSFGFSPDSPHSLFGISRPESPSNYFGLNHPWSLRSSLFANQASLRLRERTEMPMLPFSIDRSSTPDTRLEDIKRPPTNTSYPDRRSHEKAQDLESLPTA